MNPQDENSRHSEATSLLSSQPSASDGDSASDEATVSSAELWEELEHPWPATYERSISLLASPIVKARQVDYFTKSPKPGATPLALRRKHMRGLERGYGTPDHGQLLPPAASEGGFRKGIAKVQSLDFKLGAGKAVSKQFLQRQERKSAEAKAYRQQLLKKQQQPQDEEEGIAMLSPGYEREMSSLHMQKQKKVKETLETKSTFWQSLFNMANILMGVGLLSLPFVFRSAGWIGGLVVIIVFGFVTWKTSILIGRELNGDPRPGHLFDDSPYKSPVAPGSVPSARMREPLKSFPDIARAAFGAGGCIMLSSVLYFELFSCLSIFFVTIGDHLHSLYPTISTTHHMIIVAVALTVPTAVLRTPSLLSYLSMVGTVATVSVVLAVFFSALFEGDVTESIAEKRGVEESGPYRTMWNTSGLPIALGLVAYCFSGHAIVPSIYSSMARPQEFESMIGATFSAVFFFCLVVAVSGYYMFGEFVEDQITISLKAEASSSADTAMKMLTWLMILTAFSKFTLTAFPLSLGIEEIIAPYVRSDTVMEVSSSIIKLLLIILSLAVAIFVPSFSFLCSLVGMICTMTVSVVFPAAAHLKLFGPKLLVGEKILDWMFVVFGSIMAVAGTIATVET